MTGANWYRSTLIILFALFLLANSTYLHAVPGLMGDEASEGENVWLLFDAKQLTITGERSYIGPLIDYVRVPFILLFGYSALALRVVVLLFSAATFWLTVTVFRQLWGKNVGLLASSAMLFSPIYLTYGRLGWAITLLPFFALLVIYFLTLPAGSRLAKHKYLLAGLAGGVGLHNHAIFLPTLAGILGAWLVAMGVKLKYKEIFSAWPAAVGFMAGFGTQLAVMWLNRDDFKDAAAATAQMSDRIDALPQLLPMIVSGSSYVARYTGIEFSPQMFTVITWVVLGLAALALIFPKRRKVSWAWALGLAIVVAVLLYMAFQFSLRYFVTLVLGLWGLAGAGSGLLLEHVLDRRWQIWPAVVAVSLAILFTIWSTIAVLVPFLSTGGSTGEFSIGNRNDSAAALVDTRSLLACINDGEPVYAPSVHIHNRLRYLSYNKNNNVDVVLETEPKTRAQWIISYRLEKDGPADLEFEKCPELKHFKVIARNRG